jgi:hypothetical protein
MLPLVMPWPEDWAPLREVRPVMDIILKIYNTGDEPRVRLEDWRWLLFFHWREYWVELQGRAKEPEAKLRTLQHPEAERRLHLYDLGELDNARLAYPGTSPSYYDLHVRGRPLPAADDQPGKPEQRAALMHAVWSAAGYPQWTSVQALDAARAAYPNHPLLAEFSNRVRRDAWHDAQDMRIDD